MMNQSFKFVLSADGTTNPTSGTIAATYLIDKSDGEGWEENSSGLFKTTYTKEDGTKIGEDYRYVGAEVNNFVSFNDDLYQIIGVFDENTHGIEGEHLVKLIATNKLASTGWGAHNNTAKDGIYSSQSSNWTGINQTTPASGNILLNQYYFGKTSTSDTYGTCGNWTYYYEGNDYKTNDCKTLVGYGIDEKLRNYIETTTWYLNGYEKNSLPKESFYLCERGLYTGCSHAPNASASTEAKIGLMYPSDYLYATGFLGSDDTTAGDSSNNGIQNWLFKGYEWTITPRSSNTNTIYIINIVGDISGSYGAYGYGLRPTFYLKSNVKITGGEGTLESPYTIDL